MSNSGSEHLAMRVLIMVVEVDAKSRVFGCTEVKLWKRDK